MGFKARPLRRPAKKPDFELIHINTRRHYAYGIYLVRGVRRYFERYADGSIYRWQQHGRPVSGAISAAELAFLHGVTAHQWTPAEAFEATGASS